MSAYNAVVLFGAKDEQAPDSTANQIRNSKCLLENGVGSDVKVRGAPYLLSQPDEGMLRGALDTIDRLIRDRNLAIENGTYQNVQYRERLDNDVRHNLELVARRFEKGVPIPRDLALRGRLWYMFQEIELLVLNFLNISDLRELIGMSFPHIAEVRLGFFIDAWEFLDKETTMRLNLIADLIVHLRPSVVCDYIIQPCGFGAASFAGLLFLLNYSMPGIKEVRIHDGFGGLNLGDLKKSFPDLETITIIIKMPYGTIYNLHTFNIMERIPSGVNTVKIILDNKKRFVFTANSPSTPSGGQDIYYGYTGEPKYGDRFGHFVLTDDKSYEPIYYL
jgi:hypothetical protein